MCFRGINRLPSAFVFLRWFKLGHISIQVCTFQNGCKQGIDQQIFNRKSISRIITHPYSWKLQAKHTGEKLKGWRNSREKTNSRLQSKFSKSFACNFQDWGCVILGEIDFPLKICWSIPCLHPSWKVHTWIEICASLNHRKKTKADGSRLIPRKHRERLVLLNVVDNKFRNRSNIIKGILYSCTLSYPCIFCKNSFLPNCSQLLNDIVLSFAAKEQQHIQIACLMCR